MFQKATNDELYNLEKAVKIIKRDNKYVVTFIIPILLNKKRVYIQKDFENLKIPDCFTQMDETLWINFDNVNYVKFFDGYAFLNTITKINIGNKCFNYNVKVTNQNEKLKKLLKGEDMFIYIDNNFINLKNVTNVFIGENKIIFNFVNSTSNLDDTVDIKPEYEIFPVDNNKKERIVNEILNHKNFIKLDNKLINKDNIYNIKLLNTPESIIVFINFVSNISKEKDGKKIISTEFAKKEFETIEEAENFVKQLIG